MTSSRFMMICALTLGACTDKSDDTALTDDTSVTTDDTSTDDTSTDDTSTDDTGETTHTLDLELLEVLSSAPLSGATAVYGDQSVTADSDGVASIELEDDAPFEVVFSLDGHLETRFQGYVMGQGESTGAYMLSEQTEAALGAALGITPDRTKGYVHVRLLDTREQRYESLRGVTGNISSTYQVVLAAAPGGAGVAPGNTTSTDENIRASLYFVNVDPGPFTVNLTGLPEGIAGCTWGTGGEALTGWQPTVHAGVWNEVQVHCE
ncbi:MAG: hypothetical protein H6739_08355 [Alphaproteobacteria bacterium]|nr:hypothetical protein [Alphaproteobacteria bacterium]